MDQSVRERDPSKDRASTANREGVRAPSASVRGS